MAKYHWILLEDLPGNMNNILNTILKLYTSIRLDIFAVLAVLVPFAVYMATLAPSVTFFDSGEFIAATASLGSAHSPGYPLFLMYAKPFSWLPFGSMAFRINVATAFSSSLACLMVYILTLFLLKDEKYTDNPLFSSWIPRCIAFSAALSFAFTPRLWLQSNHDKPYPLLAFITATILYLLLKWQEQSRTGNSQPKYIYASAFLAGLATALHQTVVLFIPAWFVFILLRGKQTSIKVKEYLLAIAFAVWGFAVNLYLPFRATQNPDLNWGDTKTFTQLIWHLLRKGYPVEPQQRDFHLLIGQLKAFNIPYEYSLFGVCLFFLGLFYLWRTNRNFIIVYLVSVVTFLLIIVGYFNTPFEMIFLTEEFFTPLYLLTAVVIGMGLNCIIQYAISRSTLPDVLNMKVYLVVTLLFLLLPASLCIKNYNENDQHNNYIAFDFATNSLRSLPWNGVLFTWGDSGAFPLWYLQGVERMREDVDLPHTPHLVFDWYVNAMPRLFETSGIHKIDYQSQKSEYLLKYLFNNLEGKRKIFIDFSTRYSVVFPEFTFNQKDIIYRIRRIDQPAGLMDVSVWDNYSLRGIISKDGFQDIDTHKAIMIYGHSYLESGEYLINLGLIKSGQGMLQNAVNVSTELQPSVDQILMRYGVKR